MQLRLMVVIDLLTDSFTSAIECYACYGEDGTCADTQETADLGGNDYDWYANSDFCGDWDTDDFSDATLQMPAALVLDHNE